MKRLAWLLGPIALFLAVHVLARSAAPQSLHADDAELLLYTQSFQAGYGSQAPLYSWILHGWVWLFGPSTLALTSFRLSLLGVATVLAYLILRQMGLDARSSRIGAYSLLLVIPFNWHSLTYLTHSTLLAVVVLGTVYAGVRLTLNATWWNASLLGIVFALGVQSKYNYLLFALPWLVVGVWLGPLRSGLVGWRWVACAGWALVVLLPHGVWAFAERESLLSAHQEKILADSGLPTGWIPRGAVEAALNVVVLGTVNLLVLSLALPWWGHRASVVFDSVRTVRIWIASSLVLCGVGLVAYMAAAGSNRSHERWVEVFLVCVPIVVCTGIDWGSVRVWRLRASEAILLLTAVGLTLSHYYSREVQSPSRVNDMMDFSFADAARSLERIAPEDCTVLAVNRSVGGNLFPHFDRLACLSADRPSFVPLKIGRPQYCMLVWLGSGTDEIPDSMVEFAEKFLGVSVETVASRGRMLVKPYRRGEYMLDLRYAIVRAQGSG